MENDEKKLFKLLNEFNNGKIEFEEFASHWDDCYVESDEEFDNEELLSAIKDKLDYTSTNPLTELDRSDGLISLKEFKAFLEDSLKDTNK